MHAVLVLTMVLGGDPFEAWPRVREAFSPALAGAQLEVAPTDTVRVHLAGSEIDPAVVDGLLAALAPHVPVGSKIELFGPNGEELTPAPLAADRVLYLGELWRSEHRSRSAGRQLGDTAVGALDGVRIAVSAGHGIRWNEGSWEYQRSIQYQLREDIHTNEIVFRHLAPMLERAGAEVVLVRDRSGYPERILQDNDTAGGTYAEEGEWQTGSSTGYGGTYRYAWVHPDGGARASWQFAVSRAEEVPLFVWYRAGTNRSAEARFEIEHAGGVDSVVIDQRRLDSRWRYLGTFPFVPERSATVSLTNVGSDTESVVIADAIRLAGGAGFVDYGGGVSGEQRWQQCAAAFAVEEDVPVSVTNDTNDVNLRPSLALWQGVDLYVSVHTNAAGGRGTSSFVFSSAVAYPGFDPNRATPLPPGTLELQEAVHNAVLATFRAGWSNDWNDRGLWGAAFGELRPLHDVWQADPGVVVPATLIELAFHDNAEDAFYLREDNFRRDAARGILSGIIAFVHREAPASAVVPPRAPSSLVARQTSWGVELVWQATPDPIGGADPEWYDVEISNDGRSFGAPIRTVDRRLELRELTTCQAIAARVVAGNAGGRSMPSRTAIVRVGTGPRVLWVDGVRRLHRTVDDAPGGPNTAARLLRDLDAVRGGAFGIDSARVEAVVAGEIALGDWDVVLWSFGETSSYDGTLRAEEQAIVAEHVANGGALALSGADIGWDLVERGDATDQAFFAEVLGAAYVDDDAESFEVEPDAGAVWLQAVPPFQLDDGTGLSYRIEFPDVLAPLGDSVAELVYATGGVAAIRSGRTFLAGFPLETIEDDDARVALTDALAINLFGTPPPEPTCGVPYGEPVADDGGPRVDAGPTGDSERPGGEPAPNGVEGGCGCTSSGGLGWLAVLFGLGLARRQRARA